MAAYDTKHRGGPDAPVGPSTKTLGILDPGQGPRSNLAAIWQKNFAIAALYVSGGKTGERQ
jgi:hypothetical protein